MLPVPPVERTGRPPERVVVSLLLPLLSVAFAAEPVTVEVVDEPVPAVVVTPTGAPVLVPACRGVVWERFDAKANRYEPIASPACGPLAPGLTLDKEGTRFRLDAEVPAAQVVRAVVVVGQGCQMDRPFPLAGCKTVTAVEGPTVTVRGAAEQ
jgi:hypothetical protein